ncbi:response regulator [Dehalococcoidia bacterium]|nr:response regulator [Dehalococcoidia bacterium]
MAVLLAEDDEALLEFFLTILHREVYEVLVAVNGREALDLTNGQLDPQIDILLSDVSMPYMVGIELAKALLQTRPDIQVLFPSGMPEQDVLNRGGG